jgi:hypothetical protein
MFDSKSGCGICGEHCSTGAGALRILQFTLPIIIPSAAPHSLIIQLSDIMISVPTASLNNQLKEKTDLTCTVKMCMTSTADTAYLNNEILWPF